MSYNDIALEDIRKAIEKKKKSTVISYLLKLRTKEDFQHLSGTQFFDIVEKTFKFNPGFFLNSIHRELSLKLAKYYGVEGRRAMERYIIENYCLYDKEQILYECDGTIEKVLSERYKLTAYSGGIFITNDRIIAQGKLRTAALGGGVNSGTALDLIALARPNGAQAAKKSLINLSVKQDLHCYGYIFPLKNMFNLRIKRHSIIYDVIQNLFVFRIKLSSTFFKNKANINQLFEILKSMETGKKFEGKTFYFLEKLKMIKNKHAKSLAYSLGGQIVNKVVKNLSYLVTNSTESTKKYVLAQEQGTKIISEDEFINLIEPE